MKRTLLVLFVLLVGCTKPNANPAQPPKSERRSLIFGRIQFPGPIKYVAVQSNLKVYLFQSGERVHLWPDGFYFAENVVPGTYQLDRVYANKVGYLLPKDVVEETLVSERSVQYLGSYSVKPFRMDDPTRGVLAKKLADEERVLLERVRNEVLETPWQEMIDKRLEELRIDAKNSAPANTQPPSQPTSTIAPALP